MQNAGILLSFLLVVLVGSAQQPSLQISRLTANMYVYTTYNTYNGERYPANGLYYLTDSGAVVIDTPWDSTQYQPLLDSIKHRHGQAVVVCLATHFHEDRTGGLAYYRSRGIRTFTTRLTDSFSRQRGMPRAETLLHNDTAFVLGRQRIETFYPGPGHTPDNIVVWFPNEGVLYGGCLIKSVDDKDLGNLGDADRLRYASTVSRLTRRFPKPTWVVPGHNGWHSTKAALHTLVMARRLALASQKK